MEHLDSRGPSSRVQSRRPGTVARATLTSYDLDVTCV